MLLSASCVLVFVAVLVVAGVPSQIPPSDRTYGVDA